MYMQVLSFLAACSDQNSEVLHGDCLATCTYTHVLLKKKHWQFLKPLHHQQNPTHKNNIYLITNRVITMHAQAGCTRTSPSLHKTQFPYPATLPYVQFVYINL